MQINKGIIIKVIVIIAILGGLIAGLIIFKNLAKKDEFNTDFYYKFEYDDNLISQSVWVYNGKDVLQENYNIYYNDKLISLTKADKAVLTIAKLDLKDHPTFEIEFRDKTGTKYKVNYKK